MSTPVPASILITTPGTAADWAMAAARALAARIEGLVVVTLDRNGTVEPGSGAILYLCPEPGPAVIAAVMAGTLRPILVMETPATIAANLAQPGLATLDIVRAGTLALIAHAVIGRAAGAQRLILNGVSDAHRLAGALGLPASAADLAEIAPHAPRAAPVPPPPNADPVGAAGHRVLASMEAQAVPDPAARGPIVWPVEVMFWGDEPGTPAPPVVDMAGPSRVLVYGPYFHLPPGGYAAEFEVTVSGRADDIPFSLELHAGPDRLVRVVIGARPSGRYLGRFAFTHAHPLEPIEMRLRMERGAIEGKLALADIRFTLT
jgi:hypothetical protein